MKKFNVFLYINFALAVLFSFLSVSVHADISIISFFVAAIYTAALYYVTFKILLVQKKFKSITSVKRFFQYEPIFYISAFVLQRSGKNAMPFVLDVFGVLIWIALTVLSYVILHYLHEKRIGNLCDEWKNIPAKIKVKGFGIKYFVQEILEWADALIQAVFTIIILNIFLFQLYEIPSESMVPTFLVKDRVIVFKTFAGPKFPLTKVGLPYFQNYKRGDIVVFRNPHYSNDHKSEVKTFLSQFVYMCTLTLVKTNVDEHGEIKADPLVKRIAGVPGEQLVMLDGVLYSRSKDNLEWTAVKEDSRHAAWDLNSYGKLISAKKIEWVPLTQEQVNSSLNIESSRRSLDLLDAKAECESIAKDFYHYAKGLNSSVYSLKERDLFVYNLFNNFTNTTVSLMTADGGAKWFDEFMNSWHKDSSVLSVENVGGDMYLDSNFRLNVMSKLLFGRLVLRSAKLISSHVPVSEWNKDEVLSENIKKASELTDYIMHLDQRNMCVFPANDSEGNPVFIPKDNFFMMGDNRYNSLDMRHSYENKIISLSDFDSMSVTYYSNLEPRLVQKERILGKASFRFFPVSRAGIPE